MNKLQDLPNKEGFKFTGVDRLREEFECVVKKDPVGCHSVYRVDNGEPCFMQLVGWYRI